MMNMKYKHGGMDQKEDGHGKSLWAKSLLWRPRKIGPSGGEMKARGGGAATKGLKFKVC